MRLLQSLCFELNENKAASLWAVKDQNKKPEETKALQGEESSFSSLCFVMWNLFFFLKWHRAMRSTAKKKLMTGPLNK